MEGSHVLTYAELIELERSLRRAKVLSVYLDGTSVYSSSARGTMLGDCASTTRCATSREGW